MTRLAYTVAFLLASVITASAQDAWYPCTVQVWDPPFDMASPRTKAQYVPLEAASRNWDIHVFFPHMKDVYWLAVNYGVADEAKRLGVRMTLHEAGGYENLDTQIAQIRATIAEKPDGIVLSAISYTGLDSIVSEIRAAGIPVIDVINGVSSMEVSAKSLVSYGDMGYLAGEYLARRHPKGTPATKVAWFPGPEAAGWVQAGDRGFKRAVAGSAVQVVDTSYGDTGKATQRKLIAQSLDAHPDIDYIAGTTVTAEAAPRILRRRHLSEEVKIISYYLSPGVYQGIRRGQILAAPVDPAVLQGRIAMDQLVRILEGKEVLKHVGPTIEVIDGDNIDAFDTSRALAPSGFRATYTVN